MAEPKREFTIEEMTAAAQYAQDAANALYIEANKRHGTDKAWGSVNIEKANVFLKGVEFAAKAFSGTGSTRIRVNIGTDSCFFIELDDSKKEPVSFQDYKSPKQTSTELGNTNNQLWGR